MNPLAPGRGSAPPTLALNLHLTEFSKHPEDPPRLTQAGEGDWGDTESGLRGPLGHAQLAQDGVVGVITYRAMDEWVWISSEVLLSGGNAQGA